MPKYHDENVKYQTSYTHLSKGRRVVSRISFDTFFQTATSHTPYDYQTRIAGSDSGTACQSQLINIPTGLGKTAAVVMAWLWNRVAQPDAMHRKTWPRRLVYCLPMRTLVEQTEHEVRTWTMRLAREHTKPRDGSQLRWLALHSPVVLMGGEDADEWDVHPEKPAILIGTQDMLLSRALNRGYGLSRYRWPMHFGLLNNDTLWVMDETQLMGVGVETSAQLDGFRRDGKMRTIGASPTWWMSATLDDARLETVDHPKPMDGWPTETLSEAEKADGRPMELITASKKLSRTTLNDSSTPLILSSATSGDYAKRLAVFVASRHQPGTLTLVVLNRVKRAREVYEALVDGKKPLCASGKVALIHSRFRPVDRERHTKLLFGEGDRIVIATQSVEAGVDVSARLLITELAPWSSLVQRIGRCNRQAKIPDAEVLWVDIEPDAKGELLLPYSKDELDKARVAIDPLTEASPQALSRVVVPPESVVRPVIRRRDLVDLFDTTPDLCGQDLDISRYIRDGDDSDVQFYWRNIGGGAPSQHEPEPQRNELCRVAIGEAAKFFSKKDKLRSWRWNPLDEKWESVVNPRPGAIYLVNVDSGGYDDDLGWTGDPKHKPTPRPATVGTHTESYRQDPDTFCRLWQELDKHTRLVIAATDELTVSLGLDTHSKALLHTAALWHDVGKAHEEFQAMLRHGDASREGTLWAKSADQNGKCNRLGFRHELASALAWLLAGPLDAPERDLVAYLIAAHHGKIRLSIRSLPNEPAPNGEDRLVARGVWHGDNLPPVPLGEITVPEVCLDLSFMKMGEGKHGPSWLARTVALRDRLGPFRLAYLELVLRAADARASKLADHLSSGEIREYDLAGKRPPLASAPGGAQAPDTVGGDPTRRCAEHGVREGTRAPGEDSRDTRPDSATRFVETARGILSYSELAPLLADRVTEIEASVIKGEFYSVPLDEQFLLDLHRRIAGDLVPEWAGRWRDTTVTVGRLEPPPPFRLPMLMRDYALDLQTRWPAAASSQGEQLLEFLAFAEGRFLTIHPFRDFNGRTIRVFALELLRRLDLPRVELAPQTDVGRTEYFAALEAADHHDWLPLMEIWRRRLIEATTD